MKILFDLKASQPNGKSKFHGGGEYCKVVFERLLAQKGPDDIIDVFWDDKRQIDPGIQTLCRKNDTASYVCYDNDDISKILMDGKYDVFYSALPYNFSTVKIPEETKFVYTIHGLRFIEMSGDDFQYYYWHPSAFGSLYEKWIHIIFPWLRNKEYKRQVRNLTQVFALTKKQKIFTVSNHSKYSMLNFFPYLKKEMIDVFYSPAKRETVFDSALEEETLTRYNVGTKKYILLVSANRWEKNAMRGVLACDWLLKRNRKSIPEDIQFLVLGAVKPEIFKARVEFKDRFIFADYVEPAVLNVLYKNAYLLVYPSLNEGFGYPPVEAMRYGTPCACSAIASIPEICGDAALYFNPFDIREIANRVFQAFDPGIMADLKKRMAVRYDAICMKQNEALEKLVACLLGR